MCFSHTHPVNRCITSSTETNTGSRLVHIEEPSYFKCGIFIVHRFCHKSGFEISALLNLPWTTVSAIIVNWKNLGTATPYSLSSRPHELTEHGHRVLKHIACKNSLSSVASLTIEFQAISTQDLCVTCFLNQG